MKRRGFLRQSVNGLAVSVLAARTARGSTAQDISLYSAGLSFTIRALQRIPTCLRSMRNSASGFEWCQVDSPFEPVLLADGESKRNWIVEGPVGISTFQPGETKHRLRHVSREGPFLRDTLCKQSTIARQSIFRQSSVIRVRTIHWAFPGCA